MNIQVNDFQWEPGKNDTEYIKLLESSRDEWQKLAQKAITKLKTLSKAQEPRVLTLEEIKDYDKPVWIDEKDGGSWKLPFYAFDLDLYAIFGCECFSIGDYGKEWLPWTSQPTDEQRKAVKWDD